jgi:hypothetical protein
MAFDFSKLKPMDKKERLTDPIGLFQRLRVTDTSINDLWLAQGDALREWNKNRAEEDISIALNTGAGKTLVGLLVGQSLVNETRGFVLYACSSIQLVEQTAKKANGYGLPITTYKQGSYSNDMATRGEAVCLTTYQALFNGKSVFAGREIAGIVFDDAHAAEHLLRDHFSLKIRKDQPAQVFSSICAEFAEYFYSIGLTSSFEEVRAGSSGRLLLVPPFEVRKAHPQILDILRSSSIPTDTETAFAWEYLKNHIELCAFVISRSDIVITPAFVPVRTLPYFKHGVRRVYLSATLSASDVFIRTFGRKPSLEIAPTTSAGECERMILIPAKMEDVTNDVHIAKDLIHPYKALILVPSYARCVEWSDVIKPPQKDEVTNSIEVFKVSAGNKKLLLTARYDGMDLPGDMCRVLVTDDLPSGAGQLERYLWEYLGLSGPLRSTIASRVVQSFGRIFRGMSDHGVAIITGKRLVEWLQIPKNLASLPHFLQKQLELGFQMSSNMKLEEVPSSIDACLRRQPEWINVYEEFMRDAGHEEIVLEPTALSDMALAEAMYAENMWNRDYDKAAKHLSSILEQAAEFSVSYACWHKIWLGYALELSGDIETARALYRQAHGGQMNIPAYREGTSGTVTTGFPAQVVAVSRLFDLPNDGRVHVPRSFERDLLCLDGSGTAKQTEEALRCLGQYLGFDSSRPDNEHGTGPDVLWKVTETTALCIDAKTDKEDESVYRKQDLGQLADHVQWVRDHSTCQSIIPCFVGPERPASNSANPQEGVKVATLNKFGIIGETLKATYRSIATAALPITLDQAVADEFEKRGFLWPTLQSVLNLIELRDMKTSLP